MRGSVNTVGGKTDLNHCICCKTEIILCRCTYNSIRIKYHDTVVRLSYSKLILGADHTERLNSTDL